MDQELLNNIREARRFILGTMKMVRENKCEVGKANVINKGAREMVQLGKLEIEMTKDLALHEKK